MNQKKKIYFFIHLHYLIFLCKFAQRNQVLINDYLTKNNHNNVEQKIRTF